MTAFGLMTYPPGNLGDEIQSLAARAFLPRVDRFVGREALDADPGRDIEQLAVILNGWFMHAPRRWPPHPKVVPLLVSMHISPAPDEGRFRRWRSIASVMLRRRGAAYLRRHGPVGARDRATLALLRAHGVEAYYSGCLTLTLDRDPALPREDIVVACDLPSEALAVLQRRVSAKVVAVSHRDTETLDPQRRLDKAAELLSLYARAKAVVGTRLHCVLPSLALETPVLFVPPDPSQTRLAIGMELARHCTVDALIAGRVDFDFDDPGPNGADYRPLREAMIRRCRAWSP